MLSSFLFQQQKNFECIKIMNWMNKKSHIVIWFGQMQLETFHWWIKSFMFLRIDSYESFLEVVASGRDVLAENSTPCWLFLSSYLAKSNSILNASSRIFYIFMCLQTLLFFSLIENIKNQLNKVKLHFVNWSNNFAEVKAFDIWFSVLLSISVGDRVKRCQA